MGAGQICTEKSGIYLHSQPHTPRAARTSQGILKEQSYKPTLFQPSGLSFIVVKLQNLHISTAFTLTQGTRTATRESSSTKPTGKV